MGLGGGDRAQHRVRMAHDVLGAGLDRDIRAQHQRLAEKRRGPGIVHDEDRAPLMGGGCERRKVLNLEGERARRFADHHAGVGTHQVSDAGADAGVVEGGLDPHALQQAVREAPRRAVGAVGHQHVVAALHEGEQRRHDRRLAGAEQVGPVALLQRGDGILQREGRGRAVAAVIGLAVLARAERGFLQRRRRLMQDRRRVIDGRVDHAVVRRRVAAEHREQRLVPVAPLVAAVLGHGLTVWALNARPIKCPRSNAFPPPLRDASPHPGRRGPRSPRISRARPPDSRSNAAPRTCGAPRAPHRRARR